MPESEQEFYHQVARRITRLIMILGAAGAAVLCAVKGLKIGLGFLIGSAVSYLSFWRWQQVVGSLGPQPKTRSSWVLVIRVLVLGAGAYVIIKLLGFNLAAALAGLLVSAAAVILEIIYELIYAGT